MRVDDPPPASARKNDDNDPRRKDVKDEHSFSRVLSKKRGGDEDGAQTSGGRQSGKDFDPAAAGLLQAQASPAGSFQAEPVTSVQQVAVPPELQQLVREISVALNAAGQQQVHIELNSNTLKGLHITIERRDRDVAIQFQSSSEQTQALLAKNIDNLSAGLSERGVERVHIEIRSPEQAARDKNFDPRSSQGQRPQAGGQRGR